MAAFEVGRNAHTSLYEVHKPGCRHLSRLEAVHALPESPSAAEAAAGVMEENDGLLVVLGSCVRGEKPTLGTPVSFVGVGQHTWQIEGTDYSIQYLDEPMEGWWFVSPLTGSWFYGTITQAAAGAFNAWKGDQ